MSGYCIELLKFMQVDENQQKKKKLIHNRKDILNTAETSEINGQVHAAKKETDEKHKKFLAYGEFDRIGFEEVSKFSKFRDTSENTRVWIGDRQVHLVYRIQDDRYDDEVWFQDGEFYEKSGVAAVKSDRLFIGVTILQFKYSQRENYRNFEQFIRNCKRNILQLVEEDKETDIKCTVLGTLGSFGLTILWLSDQYVDILKMVTKIKNTDIGSTDRKEGTIILSAYTIFAQNHKGGADWDKKVCDIKGDAILRLTLKRGVNADIYERLNTWKEENTGSYHCAGEHDVVIMMKSSKIFSEFEKEKDLYYDSNFFKDNVLQSNVQICEFLSEDDYQRSDQTGGETDKNTDVPEEPDVIDSNGDTKDSERVLPLLEDIQKNYKQLRLKFERLFPSAVGMVDTLDLLYGDYISKISIASNEMWADDFSHQFLNVLEYLVEFIEKFDTLPLVKESVLEIVDDLLGDFEWQISHIAQSNNLVLGTPVCQFRYSGQNNLTLYAYFGIIKNVLRFVYTSQEISIQDEIVPLLVVGIVPTIQSRIYNDYKSGTARNYRTDSRIITINLPMVSLYDPVCYYPYLYHEVFHYVAPVDRYQRNRVFGHLISVEILYSIFKMVMKERLRADGYLEIMLDQFLRDYFLKYIYASVAEIYDGYIGCLVESLCDGVSNGEAAQRILVAAQFEEKMFRQWFDWINEERIANLNSNPIYRCICKIYEQFKFIRRDIKNWENVNTGERQVLAKGIKDFIEDLNSICEDQDAEAANKNLQKWLSPVDDYVLNDAYLLIYGVKEAMADIAMVEMGHMDFPKYLLLFTKTRKNLLLGCSDKDIHEQDIIRTGMVLDTLYPEHSSMIMEAVNGAKETYIDMYCGLYYSRHEENKENYWQELSNEAEKWFHFWYECCLRYCMRYRLYGVLLKQLKDGLLVTKNEEKLPDDFRYWNTYIEHLKSYGNYMRDPDVTGDALKWEELRRDKEQDIFNLNVQLVQNYQFQEGFTELNERRLNRIEQIEQMKYRIDGNKLKQEIVFGVPVIIHGTGIRQHHWIYRADNVGQLSMLTTELAEQLKQSNVRVLGKNEYPIWYRGQQSAEYKLIPNVMRKYKDEKQRQSDPDEFSLSVFLRQKFEEFKFRADGAYEAIDRIGYTDSDYLALMQHYFAVSNFLDWSEEVLPALYFALEGFLDEKAEKTKTAASLYVFSPMLYNHVRLKKLAVMKDKYRTGGSPIENDVVEYTMQEGIPNLTVAYNTEKYYMYLFGRDKHLLMNRKFVGKENMTDKWPYYSPLAIYVSRLNKRIQAQSGIFLAYNIYTFPDEKDSFDYIALEEIQNHYLMEYREEPDTCPFLYKIEIEEAGREKIANWVRAFGMSKEKCYPELANIGERVMRSK